MKTENLAIRLLILLLGVFILAFGVALSIRSDLGTTPISSVPYVYNIKFTTISVGTFTILLNIIFVVIQVFLLKKNFKLFHLLQIPVLILFGWFIDINLLFTASFIPSGYIMQWIFCLVSCFIIAFGVFLQVKANVSILPGDGLVIAVAESFKKEFGITKIIFDSLLVAIALISTLILTGGLYGVREGTVASALLVGFIVQFYQRNFRLYITYWNCRNNRV